MSTYQMVEDLELLAQLSLVGNEEPGWNRVAYFAGLVTGLRIAKKFAETRVNYWDPRLLGYLNCRIHPIPPLNEFVSEVYKYTEPHVFFDLTIFEATGLRHGVPGELYAAGMRDAVKVGIHQAPALFEILAEDSHFAVALWLSKKIIWAEEMLRFENLSQSK